MHGSFFKSCTLRWIEESTLTIRDAMSGGLQYVERHPGRQKLSSSSFFNISFIMRFS